ncbi:MAG: glucosaminidase domain-containing protein [Steroidobacteraceae bacterium]
MAIESIQGSFFADPASLSGLKREAAAQTPEAVRETARQFESLFTTMMLKSMRSASMGDPMFDSSQGEFYQEMFDQQLAMQLSKGRGMGLSDMLVRQLMQGAGAPAASDATADVAARGAAAATSSGTTSANWPPASKEDFVNAIRPAATAAASELGVDPEVIIAHAALETGWGRHMPTGSDGRPSFNLFGIKAGGSWKGASTESATSEFGGGRMQQVSASFRAYESPEDSLQDYVGLLKGNPRYAAALGTGGDAEAFAQGLTRGGYATDPDYVAKLTAVAARLKSGNFLPLTATNAI